MARSSTRVKLTATKPPAAKTPRPVLAAFASAKRGPPKHASPPAHLAFVRQAPLPSIRVARATSLVEDGYAGLKDFRDIGGALIAEVSATGKVLNVGTSADTILLRLRAASKHPRTAAGVPPELVLRYDKAKERILEIRTIVAIGGRAVFVSKSGRVLVDRHPGFEHGLIDRSLQSIRKRAAEDARGAMEERIAGLETRISDLVERMAASTDRDQDMVEVKKALRQLLFARGADAAVADRTKPKAKDLDGFRDED